MKSEQERSAASRSTGVPIGRAVLVGWALACVCAAAVAAAAMSAWGDGECGSTTRDERKWRQEMEVAEAGPSTRATGGASDAFITLTAYDFSLVFGDGQYLDVTRRYCAATRCFFGAGLPVPHGATIVGAEIDACDDDASGGAIKLIVYRIGGNESAAEELGSVLAGSGCTYSYSELSHHVVDQYLDNYVVLVDIWAGAFTERFQAVRVYYRSGSGELVPTGTEPSLFP